MSLSFLLPSLRFNPLLAPLADLVLFVQDAIGLEYGFESSVGLALALIIFALPTTIVDYYYTRNARGIEGGVTNFLRDLVEIRKTGLSPERCIIDLSKRNYGVLTPILQEMARRLGWGFTFQKIYDIFRNKVRSWLARVNIYLLYEATEVGGGSPETLESLAYFSEAMESLEKEKRMIITPLLLVPYVGGIVLTFATLLLLTFSKSMLQIVGAAVAIVPLINLFVPPLMIHAFLSGLVAGKISGGRVTNGFKHGILLLIITLIAAYLSPILSLSLQI
jgi:flagellar protein FlaJ